MRKPNKIRIKLNTKTIIKHVPLTYIKLKLNPRQWRHFEQYMHNADMQYLYWCTECDMPYCTCACLQIALDMGGEDYPQLVVTN